MGDETSELKAELQAIKDRNKRVEADKAWETSIARTLILAFITYVVAAVSFYVLGDDRPFLNALFAAIGFLLSVQSLPFVKKLWIKRHLDKR